MIRPLCPQPRHRFPSIVPHRPSLVIAPTTPLPHQHPSLVPCSPPDVPSSITLSCSCCIHKQPTPVAIFQLTRCNPHRLSTANVNSAVTLNNNDRQQPFPPKPLLDNANVPPSFTSTPTQHARPGHNCPKLWLYIYYVCIICFHAIVPPNPSARWRFSRPLFCSSIPPAPTSIRLCTCFGRRSAVASSSMPSSPHL